MLKGYNSSSHIQIDKGDAQGSILRPKLLTLYIIQVPNNLQFILSQRNCYNKNNFTSFAEAARNHSGVIFSLILAMGLHQICQQNWYICPLWISIDHRSFLLWPLLIKNLLFNSIRPKDVVLIQNLIHVIFNMYQHLNIHSRNQNLKVLSFTTTGHPQNALPASEFGCPISHQ